jgi:ribonuclease HI
MRNQSPHFLLFSETRCQRTGRRRSEDSISGQWRFVLESVDGQTKLEAADEELAGDASRLELLAVVRGLEALDQPSRVTLVTSSRYVTRGLRFGLQQWRDNDWNWERFGEMTRVKNWDLWQRIDRALKYHDLECRSWRFDPPHPQLRTPKARAPRIRKSTEQPHSAQSAKPVAAEESAGLLATCSRMLKGVFTRHVSVARGKLETQAA